MWEEKSHIKNTKTCFSGKFGDFQGTWELYEPIRIIKENKRFMRFSVDI